MQQSTGQNTIRASNFISRGHDIVSTRCTHPTALDPFSQCIVEVPANPSCIQPVNSPTWPISPPPTQSDLPTPQQLFHPTRCLQSPPDVSSPHPILPSSTRCFLSSSSQSIRNRVSIRHTRSQPAHLPPKPSPPHHLHPPQFLAILRDPSSPFPIQHERRGIVANMCIGALSWVGVRCGLVSGWCPVGVGGRFASGSLSDWCPDRVGILFGWGSVAAGGGERTRRLWVVGVRGSLRARPRACRAAGRMAAASSP